MPCRPIGSQRTATARRQAETVVAVLLQGSADSDVSLVTGMVEVAADRGVACTQLIAVTLIKPVAVSRGITVLALRTVDAAVQCPGAPQRQAYRQVHAGIVAGDATVLIFLLVAEQVHGKAHVLDRTDTEITGQGQVPALTGRAIPIGLVAVTQISGKPQIPKLLVECPRVNRLAAAHRTTVMARTQVLIHAHVVFLGKPVARKRDLTVVLVEVFRIAQPKGIA